MVFKRIKMEVKIKLRWISYRLFYEIFFGSEGFWEKYIMDL